MTAHTACAPQDHDLLHDDRPPFLFPLGILIGLFVAFLAAIAIYNHFFAIPSMARYVEHFQHHEPASIDQVDTLDLVSQRQPYDFGLKVRFEDGLSLTCLSSSEEIKPIGGFFLTTQRLSNAWAYFATPYCLKILPPEHRPAEIDPS